MDEGDEGVRFTAAILGAEADDGGDFTAAAGDAEGDGLEQLFHAAGGIAFGEECGGVEVVGGGGAVDDTGEVGHKFVVANGAGEHVGAWAAGVEDGRQTHGGG